MATKERERNSHGDVASPFIVVSFLSETRSEGKQKEKSFCGILGVLPRVLDRGMLFYYDFSDCCEASPEDCCRCCNLVEGMKQSKLIKDVTKDLMLLKINKKVRNLLKAYCYRCRPL